MKVSKKIRLVFLALLLLLFCWQVVRAPWFLTIQDIVVENTINLSSWQVESLAGVTRGMSLLKLDTDQIKARLEADSRISSAEVRRKFPSTLLIKVEENVGVAAIPYFSNWLEVDQQGRVLAVAAQFASLNLPVVTGLEQGVITVGELLTDEEGWTRAATCLAALPSTLQSEISEINVSDPESIVLYSRDPLRILVGDCSNLETKFASLAAMLDRVRVDHRESLATGQLDVSSGKAVFNADR